MLSCSSRRRVPHGVLRPPPLPRTADPAPPVQRAHLRHRALLGPVNLLRWDGVVVGERRSAQRAGARQVSAEPQRPGAVLGVRQVCQRRHAKLRGGRGGVGGGRHRQAGGCKWQQGMMAQAGTGGGKGSETGAGRGPGRKAILHTSQQHRATCVNCAQSVAISGRAAGHQPHGPPSGRCAAGCNRAQT